LTVLYVGSFNGGPAGHQQHVHACTLVQKFGQQTSPVLVRKFACAAQCD